LNLSQGIGVLFIAATLIILFSHSSQAINRQVFADDGIEFKENRVSTDIKNTPLKDVLAAFQSAKEISYQGPSALLGIKISKSIENATIEDALKRILFHFDYALIYNADSQVIQARVVNNKPGHESVATLQGQNTLKKTQRSRRRPIDPAVP
jgi:hypothetical protein